MRLWHKALIEALPRQQLVSQWRELLAIKGAIDKNGTPNHRLVNYVLDYPIGHFKAYAILVYREGKRRGYNFKESKLDSLLKWESNKFSSVPCGKLFRFHHNLRYLDQCYFNLEEKFDRGIITREEFDKITDAIEEIESNC